MASSRFSYELTIDDDIAYVRRHLQYFAGGQVFLETSEPADIQDLITFTVRDPSGAVRLSASGIVTQSLPPGGEGEGGVAGMVVSVKSADDDGYRWLRETFYAAQEKDLYPDLDSDETQDMYSSFDPDEARMSLLTESVKPDYAAVDFLEPLRRGAGGPIVGIDLGTTNSCVSAFAGGEVRIIPGPTGQLTMPSVVSIDGDEVLIGHEALKRLVTHPESTIYGSKRLIGRKFVADVREELQREFRYELVESKSRDIAVTIGDRTHDLRSIAAMMLTELRGYAEAYLEQPVLRAVITVPAYFNENQRYAVREAGIMAGLVVERILNEPTAAALAYGYDRARDKTILVYDLGGGTFDVSLLHVDDNVFRVLATGGDTFLGGIDFDNELVDYLLEEFYEAVGAEVPIDRVGMQRLVAAAQDVKHRLSSSTTAEVVLPHFAKVGDEYRTLEVSADRETFERLCAPLVDRTLDTCMELLASQRMEPADLDVILLVGGQTRMPLVHRRIEERIGLAPSRSVNPDEAVGLGAGIYANLDSDPDKVKLQDVLPIAIGVGLPGGRFQPVLQANTPIPASRTIPLTTVRDDQDVIEFEVFQGDSENLADTEYLGTFVIDDIPPGAKGEQSFGVEFALNAECLLYLTAMNYNTGQVYEKTLTTPLTPEQVIQRLKLMELGRNAFGIATARIPDGTEPGVWIRVSRWIKSLFGGTEDQGGREG